VYFAAKSSTLTTQNKTTLLAFSKKLVAGESIALTGYARANAPLARKRALAVATYLTQYLRLNVTIKATTNTASDKVTLHTG
jgi:outer membrane protein OmpA-like peptidoglycan-associated protein